jgi:hypothetical protein
VFRFNARARNDAERFFAALKGADGKRLTYAALTIGHPGGASATWMVVRRRPSAQTRRTADPRRERSGP